MITLTNNGRKEIAHFICEAKAKRKEILDARLDTATETELPTEEDILQDIEFFEADGEYWNSWGVTDNYNTDYPLCLTRGIHYI